MKTAALLLKSLYQLLDQKLVPVCDIIVSLVSGLWNTFSVCDDLESSYLKFVCSIVLSIIGWCFLNATVDYVSLTLYKII